MKRLEADFYHQDGRLLAKLLLGKIIVRQLEDGTIIKARIVETEIYYGEEDSASHAYKGKKGRAEIMYEQGGYAYIYLCYGLHYLFNVVTGSSGHPQAVLIRGIEGYNGPSKLTKYLQIDGHLNKENLLTSSKLWIEDDGYKGRYKSYPRIGIDYATAKYRHIKWRYVMVKRTFTRKMKKYC